MSVIELREWRATGHCMKMTIGRQFTPIILVLGFKTINRRLREKKRTLALGSGFSSTCLVIL